MESRGGDVFGGEFWRDGGVRGGGVAPYPGPGVGVLDDVHLKIVLKLRLAGHPDIVIVMTVLIPRSLFSMCHLQTRSTVAYRYVTWMQQWASQPPVTSVRGGDHKCGVTSESGVDQAVIAANYPVTHQPGQQLSYASCHCSALATETGR